MSISEILKHDIEAYALQLRDSNQLFRRAESGELTPSAIATYLTNMRFLVQHTDVNLRLARRRAEQLGRPRLARFFEQKAKEEDGHYRWAERDMATLNGMFDVRSTRE